MNTGKTAVVVGANRGLGLAFTRGLLAKGWFVIGTARDPENAKALHALQVPVVALDLLDGESIHSLPSRVSTHTDRIHLLLCVAGLLHSSSVQPEKRLEQLDLSAMQTVFGVNAFGPILVSRALFPLLKHGERAVIAMLSARVGSIEDNRLGGWYSYRASKAAQNQLTRTLAIELSRRAKNVIAVALHPGTVDTDLSKPFHRNVPAGKLFDADWAASRLLQIVEGLESKDSGSFFAWDGQPIPW